MSRKRIHDMISDMMQSFPGLQEEIADQDQRYDIAHRNYMDALQQVEEAKTRSQHEEAARIFEPIRQLFLRNRESAIPTEVWQIIISFLDNESRMLTGMVDRHLHNEVVYGLNSAKFVWQHGVDAIDQFGRTMLFAAAAHDYVEVARMLISAGSDINYVVPGHDESALHIASSPEMVQMLIENKADVNVANEAEVTPLWTHAVWNNFDSPDIIRLLIAANADVTKRPPGNESILFNIPSEHANLIAPLVAAGADVEERTAAGFTPLHTATHSVALTRAFVEAGANIHATSGGFFHGSSALMIAVAENKPDVVQYLISAGADVNQHSDNAKSLTALHIAVRTHNVQVGMQYTKMLLDAGARIDEKDGDGWTPLLSSCYNFNYPKEAHIIVQLLLDNGADPNAQSIRGRNSLHVLMGQRLSSVIDRVRVLLLAGTRVNEKDDTYGDTPLHMLMESNALPTSAWRWVDSPVLDVVQLLMQFGADPHITNNLGKTALDIAPDELVQLIQKIERERALSQWRKTNDPRALAAGRK